MAAFNSRAGYSHQDDSDITIINPSILHENDDEYVDNTQITNSQGQNNNSQNQTMDGRQDYIFVDHDPLKIAKQLEEVLIFYIRDLKQESNSELVCDQQLVTRLMNIIRPAYPNDQTKTNQLDQMMAEIGALHDKRHVEQEEKIAQLRSETGRLNKMLCTASNDNSLYDDQTRSYSIFSTANRGHSIHDYEQWTEIEEDAKKLNEIVQSQRNQINEIVTLISQTATMQNTTQSAASPVQKPNEISPGKPTTPAATATPNIMEMLLKKIHNITTPQQTQSSPAQPDRTTDPSMSNTTLINHSPGTSPTQSLDTLTSSMLTTTIVDPAETKEPTPTVDPVKTKEPTPTVDPPRPAVDPVKTKEPTPTVDPPRPAVDPMKTKEPTPTVDPPRPVVDSVKTKDPTPTVDPPRPVVGPPNPDQKCEESRTKKSPATIPKPNVPTVKVDRPHPGIDIPVRPEPAVESKRCPVCNHEFALGSNDVEMYDHIERCLFPTGIRAEPRDYECPYCARKYPGTDETQYIAHMSDCVNRDN